MNERIINKLRCLFGLHDWAVEHPPKYSPPFTMPKNTCRRCGKVKYGAKYE
jgi:hypothetical protein